MTLRLLFSLAFFLFIVLLTFNWAYTYFANPVTYPYERKKDLVLVSSNAVTFIDLPVNTKEIIKVETVNVKKNIFHVEYKIEITLVGNASAIMHFEQGIRADYVLDMQVLFNGAPLTLLREKGEYNTGEYVLDLDSRSLEFTESQMVDFYFIPDFNLTGNSFVDRLDISVTLYRTLKSSQLVNAPWGFSSKKYALFVDVPIFSALVSRQNTSHQIVVETNCGYPFQTVETCVSGWMGTYTLRKFVENPYRWASVLIAPIEQNISYQSGVFLWETFFSENNKADRLIVTFIPHFSIFLSILAFLYIPFFVRLIGIKREWGISKKLSVSYTISFVTFLGFNISTLEHILLLFHQITDMTSILFTAIVLSFPALYTILEPKIPTRQLSSMLNSLVVFMKRLFGRKRLSVIFLIMIIFLLALWQREPLAELFGLTPKIVYDRALDIDAKPVGLEDPFFRENNRWYLRTAINLSNFENFAAHLQWAWFGFRNITFVDGSVHPYAIVENHSNAIVIHAHSRFVLSIGSRGEGLQKQPVSAEVRFILRFAESELKGQLDYNIPY